MDAKALRNWGVGVGGAMLAAAVGVATLTGDPAPATKDGPAVAGPIAAAPSAEPAAPAAEPAAEPDPVFETASVDPPPAVESPSFIVRFSSEHPLARAQTLAAEGREQDARRAAEQALGRQRALRGLCFDRFTLGGAEIVLKVCDAVSAAERDQVRRTWAERLSAMPGVTYAESNAILQPEAGRRP